MVGTKDRDDSTRPRRDERISEMLARRIEAGDFPSAVYVVAEGGSVRFAEAIGDAVREPARHPAAFETIYDLASLTKPLVTGLLCALMCERGRFHIDDEAAHHLPEFDRADKRQLTLRQLLTHTSGLPAWRPLYALGDGARENALALIAAQSLEYEPGTRVLYSDLGFITLGILLSRLAGAELSEIARREVFDPLSLRRTFFNPDLALRTEVAACESAGNVYEREMCRNAHGVEPAAGREGVIWGEVHDGNAHFLGGAAGHAGLFSNARDTLKIAEQFLPHSSQLFSASTCALFRTNLTEELNEARSFAWQLAATKDSTAGPRLAPDSFGHLGFTGTSCWIDPTRATIFILLTNRTHARQLPFANINSARREFHTLAVEALERG